MSAVGKVAQRPAARGRPRKVAITLPPVGSLSPDARVTRAALSLALQGDPLGLTTGEYRARPVWTVGDATPERLDHARRAGVKLDRIVVKTDAGAETAIRRKQFVSKLDQWHARGTIDDAELLAARRFQAYHTLQWGVGPAVVSRYGEYLDRGRRELHPLELQVDCGRKVALAVRSVPRLLHPVLAWIAQCAGDDVSLEELMGIYWRPPFTRTLELRTIAYVQLVLGLLCDIYGIEHRWQAAVLRVRDDLAAYLEGGKKVINSRDLDGCA